MKTNFKNNKIIWWAVLTFIIGGIGGWIVPRWILPYFGVGAAESPIIITRREEVHINEGINTVDIGNKLKDSLVRVYIHLGSFGSPSFRLLGSVPGAVVTSDGVVVIAGRAASPNVLYTVVLPDGKTTQGEFVDEDSFSGLSFLKVDKKDMVIAKQGFTRGLSVGEKLIILKKQENHDEVSVKIAVLSEKAILNSGFLHNFSFDTLNIPLVLDSILTAEDVGSVIINKDGALVGFVVDFGKNIGAVRVEDFTRAMNNLFSNKKIVWPSFKLSYEVLSADQAVLIGYPSYFGVLVKASSGQLREGDFIYEVDGNTLTLQNGFQDALLAKTPGEKVNLKLLRGGKVIQQEINL